MIPDVPEPAPDRTMPKTVIVVSYQKWVSEGNNYAGYDGYRDAVETFSDRKALLMFLEHIKKEDIFWIAQCGTKNMPVKPLLVEAANAKIARLKADELRQLKNEEARIKARRKALGA